MTAAPAIHTTDRNARRLAAVAEQFSADSIEKMTTLETRVTALAKAKRDAVVDTRSFTAIVPQQLRDEKDAINHVVLHAPSQGLTVAINDLAHDQLADRTGIPRDYYRRMLAGQPDLLAHNINTWFAKEPDRRLFRMLTPTTTDEMSRLARMGAQMMLRGVLGASYRMIDDAELTATVLPVAKERGAFLKEFSLDERRFHAQFVTREQSIQDIRARVANEYGIDAASVATHQRVNGHDVSWVNEIVRAGFYMRNSEVGFASMEVTTFLDVLKCLNGMIQPSEVVVRHLGKRGKAEAGELNWLSAATQELDNAALMSRARDAVLAALDDRQVVKLGNTLLAAKTEAVELPVPLFEWCDNVGERLGLNDSQRDLYKEETSKAVIEEGGRTRFALTQGLTALARQTEDFDRRAELERTGWSWLESTPSELVKLGAEVAKKRTIAKRN